MGRSNRYQHGFCDRRIRAKDHTQRRVLSAPTTTPQPETTAVPVVAAAPAPTTFVTYTPPAPKSVVQPEPAASSSAPVSSSANDGSPLSGGVSILSTCNKYRAKYGLAPFTWSSTLASNAAKTGQMNNGQTENHKLFDGSFGQVITPGLNSAVSGVNLAGFTPFEMGYLSWMCEKSTDSQLSGLCEPMQSAMHMMYSSTGHYDILTSSNYKEIGCSFTQNPSASSSSPYQGLWTCDFAF